MNGITLLVAFMTLYNNLLVAGGKSFLSLDFSIKGFSPTVEGIGYTLRYFV